MSGAPSKLPPPVNPALLPTFGAVTYLAAIIALWGFLSLLLDRDVVNEPDAGPILGPAMAAAATVVTWVVLLANSRRPGLWGAVVAATLCTWALMLIVGAVGYAGTRGEPAWLLLFTAEYALSPFILGPAVLSGLAVVAVWAMDARGRSSS